jgi:hypothetical protein
MSKVKKKSAKKSKHKEVVTIQTVMSFGDALRNAVIKPKKEKNHKSD